MVRPGSQLIYPITGPIEAPVASKVTSIVKTTGRRNYGGITGSHNRYLKAYYQKFGFCRVTGPAQLPGYFRLVQRLSDPLRRLRKPGG